MKTSVNTAGHLAATTSARAKSPFAFALVPEPPVSPSAPSYSGRRGLAVAILSSATLVLCVGKVSAQIVTYTTVNLTGATTTVSPTTATGATASTMSRTGLTANSGSNTYASTGNLYTQNTPDFNQKYVGYTVAPTSTTSSVLFAKTITVSASGSNTAPNQLGIAYSTDGFSSNLFATGSVTATDTVNTYDITDLITNDTVAVRVQDYGTTGVSGASASGGSFRLGSSTNPASVVTGSVLTAASSAVTLTANTEVRTGSSITLGGVVSGNFSLTKNEVGSLLLANSSNSYTGGTTVSGGKLLVNNATGSGTGTGAVTVKNSGTLLGGTGAISGAVSLANSTVLAAGATGVDGSIGTLKTGALTLNDLTDVRFDLTTAGTSGGVNNDLLSVTGNLTLDGKLSVNGLSGFGEGTYTLFTYTGSLVDHTLDVSSAPGGFTYSIDTATAGSVFLDVAAVPEPSTWIGGGLLLGLAGWSQRKRLGALLAA